MTTRQAAQCGQCGDVVESDRREPRRLFGCGCGAILVDGASIYFRLGSGAAPMGTDVEIRRALERAADLAPPEVPEGPEWQK